MSWLLKSCLSYLLLNAGLAEESWSEVGTVGENVATIGVGIWTKCIT